MAKATQRKLKVFQARLGFYDTVLAVPSQAAALRVWGTTQNLFASGDAMIATDAAAISAALTHPETVLRRPIGTSDPFAIEPKSLPKLPDLPAVASKRKRAEKSKPPAPPKPPDRTGLDAAEAALRCLDEQHKNEEAGFRREKEDLDARRDCGYPRHLRSHASPAKPYSNIAGHTVAGASVDPRPRSGAASG